MGKSFFFSQNPLSKRVALHEASRDQLNASMGLTEADLTQAKAYLTATGAGNYPTQETVGHAPVRIRGEEFQVMESYRDGDKQISVLARRKDAGGMEQIRAVEEYASEHTRVVTDVRGYYGRD